jgi:hypothetical protein
MAVIAVHQPMYLPYLGFFNKLNKVDEFVLLDDAEFSSGYYYNRNRIKGPNGEIMLTVPIVKKEGMKLNEVKTAKNIRWQEKHFKSLDMNYKKSKYFKEYKSFFKDFYSKNWEKLHDLNIETLRYLMEQLDITTPIHFSSKLLKGYNLKKSERLVEICKKLNAKRYLSGIGGRNYLDEKLFEKNSIKVDYQNYYPREYSQLFPPFIPNLSVIDLVFNMGKKSMDFI